MAISVSVTPRQTGFFVAIIVTLTGDGVFTVIVIVFDVAGLPVAQLKFDVTVQAI